MLIFLTAIAVNERSECINVLYSGNGCMKKIHEFLTMAV